MEVQWTSIIVLCRADRTAMIRSENNEEEDRETRLLRAQKNKHKSQQQEYYDNNDLWKLEWNQM